ncbi:MULTISPECIES: AMP-binding protein [unclassified Streptomyces]|uniref:AMP-binding protein n=1 Tax=unclassified Streptomyces TaxID=2593676 RepID=UPI000DACBB02|nr:MULTISPECIES: AMP-binding protein [unclassified Streptomyces]PZT71684.1 acyl-CoA synthetase [Streptomyces sp. AC1-42T]PZT73189.1 acyl-CoA synthetase [Streptomyces sp. AC1-42W]
MTGQGPITGLLPGFLTQVRERPDAPALVWHGEETSYRELYESAGRERERLALLGPPAGEPVGILAEKSPDAIALVLGCLLAHRPFLLPSPHLGEQLLTRLFAQAGCGYVLTPGGEPRGVRVPARSAAYPVPPRTAFMLTTSGSTGLPKTVPLDEQAVDRFVSWAGPAFAVAPGTTVLNYAPLNFDLCFLDVWTTLAHGGRVVLVDPDKAVDGRHLLDLLLRHDVEIVQAVPMFYRLVLDAARRAGVLLPSVRRAAFTGDALPERTLAELREMLPAARLTNIYGCTETNDSFTYDVGTPATESGPLPIGTPLPGVSVLVLDAEGREVTGPGAGELHVRTPFQTAGYLDPARSRGRFTGHPLGHDDGAWFRTGDLVRRDADGLLHLTGRSDFQVKVRGVAVNTAEIEQVLLSHPAVLEAGVAAQPDPLTGKRLVAGVRRAPGSGLNSLLLKEHCARALPRAAVPGVLRITDEPLPKTLTGKVDRTALDRLSGPSRAPDQSRRLTTVEGRTS